MKTKSVYSTADTVDGAVGHVHEQLEGFETKVLFFFASSRYDPSIGAKMQDAFKGATVLGCTTAGEITSGKMLKNSVVAMAIGPEVIADAKVAAIEKLDEGVDVSRAFKTFEEHFKVPVRDMDASRYVGIVLIDGLCEKEEEVMNQIGDMSEITILGGSAGDDLSFRQTYLYSGGKAYTGAAVLALFRTKNGFDVIKTQSFGILKKKFVVTRVNEAGREVLELNGRPAAVAYAEAVGSTVAEAPDHFMHNPVGLVVNDEPFVRSPQRLNGQGIVFYCNIPEGMEVSLLEAGDIIRDTRRAVEAVTGGPEPVVGILNFHCILRTLELENKGLTDAYGEIFAHVPAIGFSTYGEEYIGHMNQTSTMLILK